jgi:hypothetical protein
VSSAKVVFKNTLDLMGYQLQENVKNKMEIKDIATFKKQIFFTAPRPDNFSKRQYR